VRSGFVRKNPSAALQAIRRAAELAQTPVTIVCKVAGREGAPDLFAALQAEAGAAGDVVMLTEWLSGEGMASLIASVDAVVSLHRSEGFGLLPAQAMAMGKAVVATGWSGNLDFMDHDSARLVDYDLVPVEDVQGLYAGGHWAEPDPEDAARKLARLMQSPFEREALGVAAAQMIQDRLDPDKWGAVAKTWLGRN
jgi:glycosyltransferase involved in cell wall biosynthesis